MRPVDLKFCVDVDFLEPSIDVGFIDNIASFAETTHTQICTFLELLAKASREGVILSRLDNIVADELQTNMNNAYATERMQDLSAQYHTILRINGLKWILTDNRKATAGHVLITIQPPILQERLTSDLSFSHLHLKKDFKRFLSHAIGLAKAFRLVDCGLRKASPTDVNYRSGKRSVNKEDDKYPWNCPSKYQTKKQDDVNGKKRPISLWEPHRSKGVRHLLNDTRDCPQDEKN